jgi:hypothetical protein
MTAFTGWLCTMQMCLVGHSIEYSRTNATGSGLGLCLIHCIWPCCTFHAVKTIFCSVRKEPLGEVV